MVFEVISKGLTSNTPSLREFSNKLQTLDSNKRRLAYLATGLYLAQSIVWHLKQVNQGSELSLAIKKLIGRVNEVIILDRELLESLTRSLIGWYVSIQKSEFETSSMVSATSLYEILGLDVAYSQDDLKMIDENIEEFKTIFNLAGTVLCDAVRSAFCKQGE